MTLILLTALVITIVFGLLRLNDSVASIDPTRYRHAAHRAHPHRRTVPDDHNPLPMWVRVRLAPTVHSRLAIGAGV